MVGVVHLLCIFFPLTDWTAQQKRSNKSTTEEVRSITLIIGVVGQGGKQESKHTPRNKQNLVQRKSMQAKQKMHNKQS